MARNTTTIDTTEERNAYVLELFRQDPDLKSSEAQERIKAKFGAALSSKVLNQLRDQAQTEADVETEPELPEESAADDAAELLQTSALAGFDARSVSAPAPKPAKSAKGAKVKHVFVEAPRDQLDFLERVVAQLQEAGVSNLKVDHTTERWLVFAVDAK